MSQDQPEPQSPQVEQQQAEQQIVIVGPDGQPVGTVPASALVVPSDDDGDEPGEPSVTEMVQQPAKVMRIGTMIKQLLEEVKAAPLDEASRARLKEIHASSITELEEGLAPELVDELHRLSLPFADDTIPSEGELRIAQAQLVGWLEGLFHGIQAAMYAQQLNARAQVEQLRRALPPGMQGAPAGMPGMPPGAGGPQQGQPDEESGGAGGMYL